MTSPMRNRSLMRALSIGVISLLFVTFFSGVVQTASATDIDPGWAIIVGLKDDNLDHMQEAMDLRTYLIERGWNDDQILFLCYGDMSYIDGEPTKKNFRAAIKYIDKVSTDNDIIFISVLDHGVDGGDGHYYLRFGENLDQYMKDTRFGSQIDRIDHYRTMIIDIAGPYSGAFIEHTEADDRIIVADCDSDEFYRTSEYTFSEALTDEDADTDGDGKVSVEEAHALMLESMDGTTPQLSDPDDDDDVVIPAF